jgi:Fic family protein
MDPQRFSHSTAGHVIRVGTGEHAYWAFAPNELPPDLAWDNELELALEDAERSLGELNALALSNPQLPVGAFIRREAVSSSAIEKIEVDIADLYAYEADQFPVPGLGRPGASASDTWEVLNYVRALEYGLDRMGKSSLNLRLIRELHKRLMGGILAERATPGEFRRSQNWIGGPGATLQEADFVPPPPNDMRAALEALEKYLVAEDRYPPLVRLALIHYQFETIHPFIDGNGRVGRMLLLLLLLRWGLLALPLLCLSSFFEQHLEDYYDLLIGVSERGAWKEWLGFLLRGVAEQAGDDLNRARRLEDLRLGWHSQLQNAGAPEWTLRLADLLLEMPLISAQTVRRRLRVSLNAATEGLRHLEGMGILQEVSGQERDGLYLATAVINAVE